MINESFKEAEDKQSLDASLEDISFNRNNFSDYQDDRKIVKIAALNDKYKLVERPRFLFLFENTTWESKFGAWIFQKHVKTEIATFVIKSAADVLLAQAGVIAVHHWDKPFWNIFSAVVSVLVNALLGSVLYCRKVQKPRLIWI